MAEIEMGYSRNDFPFAGIFEDVTEVATQQSFSPVEAYVWYQKERVERGLNPGPDYCSTPITNCGHARRDDLTSLETIQKNTETGQRMLAELAREGILHAKSAILPADLGYVPGWSQVDYMTLWLSVIGAPDLDLQETKS